MASVLFNQNRSINMKMKLSFVVLAALLFIGLTPASSSAYIGISVGIAPPAIPIYTQPYCPAPGYIWTPGYWAWDGFGYYWVPGVWVAPPRIGFLWTPGYWGYNGSHYFFNDGYWGPTVGFYGGINYGYGYGGQGYYGGRWVGNTFRYNRAVTRVNTSVIRNTYVNKQVVRNTGSRASFNGPGGTTAKPAAQEEAAAKAEHIPATSAQQSRVEAAKNNPELHAANNQGKPKAEAIKALDRNNEAQAGAGKAKGKATDQAAKGNSAFGHKQGDATTRTTGSQNNAYGKARSAEAHDSHRTGKAARTEEGAAPHAAKAERGKHNGEARNAAGPPHAAKHQQTAPHRTQAVKGRQTAPGRGPAPAAQNAKKKKKGEKEKPNGGQ
jgi:hypothetical protein